MATITIKINERSKAGKTLQNLIELLSSEPGVEIVTQESPYDPAFVEKINQARKEKGGKVITAENLWESIK